MEAFSVSGGTTSLISLKETGETLSNKLNSSHRKLARKGKLTAQHKWVELRVQTQAKAPPGNFFEEFFKSTKGAIFSGLVAAVLENSQEYVSTDGGHATAKIGIGGVNTLASYYPTSAALVGVSTVADVFTEWAFGFRLGAHEVLNTPVRLTAALVEDEIIDGRGIYRKANADDIFKTSATERFVADLRTNRGAVSMVIAGVGTPAEMIVEHTPVGDAVAWAVQFQEWQWAVTKYRVIQIKDTISSYFR